MASNPVQQLPRMLGRNGWDDPINSPDELAAEMKDIDPYEGSIGMRRHGFEKPAVTDTSIMVDTVDGWGDSSLAFTGDEQLASLNTSQSTRQQLFILGSADVGQIISVGTAAYGKQYTYALTYSSTASELVQMNAVAINGKVFIAGNSNENRLSVLESTATPLAGGVARRSNLKSPGAATVADTGAGAYAAVLRYYRVSMAFLSGSTVLRESNLGASVAFTPSGGGTAARVTRPAAISENETHWIVYVSLDNSVYYKLATVAIATTTYDDSTATTAYSAGTLAPVEGANTPFPSCKYLLVAFNRLMGFGSWGEAAGDSLFLRDGHVVFSPPRGASDQDVEEVVRNTIDEKGVLPLAENATAVDRAFCGPMEVSGERVGSVFAFQDRGIYRIVPTGVATNPFRSVPLTTRLGAVSNKSTFIGEDEYGRPCIYFLDPDTGPCRITNDGQIQWIGKDVFDIWKNMNHNASVLAAHGHYDSGRKQVRFWLTLGIKDRPGAMIMLSLPEFNRVPGEPLRGGWHQWLGAITEAMSSVIHNVSLVAQSAGVPYMMIPTSTGLTTPRTQPPFLYRLPYTGMGLETIAPQIVTKAYSRMGLFQAVRKIWILADALTSGTITVGIIRDTDTAGATTSQEHSLTPVGTQTQVFRYVDGLTTSQAWAFQIKIGNSTDVGQWNLLGVYLERADEGPAHG